jgi:SET domain-containing protein
MIVKRSPIAGLGGFAACDIPKGTRIIEYTGERISAKEAYIRWSRNRRRRILLFSVNGRTFIDAAVNGGPAKRINHSCQGNCEAQPTTRGRVYIVARRNIKAGEELTYDYRLDLGERDLPHAKEIYPCRCGSSRCRGTMATLPKPLRTRVTTTSTSTKGP